MAFDLENMINESISQSQQYEHFMLGAENSTKYKLDDNQLKVTKTTAALASIYGKQMITLQNSTDVHKWKFLVIKRKFSRGIVIGISCEKIEDVDFHRDAYNQKHNYAYQSNGITWNLTKQTSHKSHGFTQNDTILMELNCKTKQLSFTVNNEPKCDLFTVDARYTYRMAVCLDSKGDCLLLLSYSKNGVAAIKPRVESAVVEQKQAQDHWTPFIDGIEAKSHSDNCNDPFADFGETNDSNPFDTFDDNFSDPFRSSVMQQETNAKQDNDGFTDLFGNEIQQSNSTKQHNPIRVFLGELGDLMRIIDSHIKFMHTQDAAVDHLISESSSSKLLYAAKTKALETERDLLQQIMNISEMNMFLSNIILIENLFNSLYTKQQKLQQEHARNKYAKYIHLYENKEKPVSEIDSFVELLFAGTNLHIGSFKIWLQKVNDKCKEKHIKLVSNSGAKAKNIERAFYKAFYLHPTKDGFKQVTDVLRASLVFDNFDDIYKCFTVIEELSKEENDIHSGVLRCKDRYNPAKVPFGYRDLLINIYCPGTKIVCEIQLHHKLFYQHKSTSHNMYKKARIFEENDINLAYEYANQHTRKTVGDAIYQTDGKHFNGEAYEMLVHWGLEQYAEKLIEDEGYDDVKDWKDITLDELKNDLNFKTGHAKKFVRLAQAL